MQLQLHRKFLKFTICFTYTLKMLCCDCDCKFHAHIHNSNNFLFHKRHSYSNCLHRLTIAVRCLNAYTVLYAGIKRLLCSSLYSLPFATVKVPFCSEILFIFGTPANFLIFLNNWRRTVDGSWCLYLFNESIRFESVNFN